MRTVTEQVTAAPSPLGTPGTNIPIKERIKERERERKAEQSPPGTPGQVRTHLAAQVQATLNNRGALFFSLCAKHKAGANLDML